MKKFHWIVGKLCLQLIKFICIIAVTSVIVITYYEDEKEELFWQFSGYLEAFEETIIDNHTMYNAAENFVGNEVTNI